MLPGHRIDGPPNAPVLVLAPSLGTTADLWADQVPALEQHFRVIRYEHRGHGGTPAPRGPYRIDDLGTDLLELLDHLGVTSASICGLSLGGMVAMWVAVHHPERVDRLVLACTAAHLPPAEAWAARAATVRAGGTSGLLDALLGRWFTPGAATPDSRLGRAVATMLAAADPEGYAGCCEAIGAMDQRPDVGNITAPTLVIGGALDPVVPPAAALELQQSIPSAGLVVIPGAAHLPNLERAEVFTTALLDHLVGSPTERGMAVRRAVLGDAHVDRAASTTSALTAAFQDLITRYAWGDIWTRPGLDRRTRSCITLAMLVGLGRFEELALHVRGALRNGLTTEEISEVLLHSAIYCGVPAANRAFAIAQQVLDEGGSG